MSSFQNHAASLLGAANNVSGMFNKVTIAVAFVLSIMVINTHNECTSTGFPASHGMVSFSYSISIMVLILCILLICLEMYKRFRP